MGLGLGTVVGEGVGGFVGLWVGAIVGEGVGGCVGLGVGKFVGEVVGDKVHNFDSDGLLPQHPRES